MGKRRRGHYCFMCARYRANEKFSGKGHRTHICKDCQRKGKTEELNLNVQSTHNPFIKQLKVKLIIITETDGYIFFDINRKTYVIHDFDEVTPQTFKYIYKYNKELDPPFELTNELDHHKEEIIEALLIKCEDKYHRSIFIDELGYYKEESYDYEPTENQMKYLRLVPALETFRQIRLDEGQDILNIMLVDID